MKVIDCFGDVCPIPIIKIEDQLSQTKKGETFMVVVDHSCVLASIEDKYDRKSIQMNVEEVMNGVWEITFSLI